MAVAKVVVAQRDFSIGEVDASFKRVDDHPEHRNACRQLSNFRILSTRAISNRSGRRAVGLESGRIEDVFMAPGQKFFLAFGTGTLRVYDATFTQRFSQGGFPWTLATVGKIVFDQYALSVYICFPGMQPQVLTWDGISQSSTWSVVNFTEATTPTLGPFGAGTQKRTFFYRISPKNISMQPSGFNTVGSSITLTFSSAVAVAGMVGTRMRYCGRQLLITAFTDSTHLTATIEETLPNAQTLTLAVGSQATTAYNIGDVVIGSVSGAQGIVTTITDNTHIVVQLLQTTSVIGGQRLTTSAGFIASTSSIIEYVIGPGGTSAMSTTAPGGGTPQAVAVWDEEVMNSFRGWPMSCFVDQQRLGFCNFPSLPAGIGWSAIGLPTDLFVDAPPAAAIFQLVPSKRQVFYVVPGMEGSEFVFCDTGVFWIPITASIPLTPSSVAFNLLSTEGCMPNVQPRAVAQSIIFANPTGTRMKAVQAPGAYYRPYIVDDISDLHFHLFKNPIAIAAPTTFSQFQERYLFVLNADGSVVVGTYGMKGGLLDAGPEGRPRVGWNPWTGAGSPTWIAALGSDLVFTTTYETGAMAQPVSIIEMLDDSQYLDAGFFYNVAPASPTLTPPGGKGPLWFMANGTVSLMDQGTRQMDTYQVDANGFLVPQFIGGENLASPQLVAGQPWTAIYEPWVPGASPGQDVEQRLRKRRLMRTQLYVGNSTGFLWQRYGGIPAVIKTSRRITTYNQDDDPTQPPPLREQAYILRGLGRDHDPRVQIVKDTSGPLIILEAAIEVTV